MQIKQSRPAQLCRGSALCDKAIIAAFRDIRYGQEQQGYTSGLRGIVLKGYRSGECGSRSDGSEPTA